jgi:transposase
LFGTAGKDHSCVHEFAKDLTEHGGTPEAIEHVCMDMSAPFAKGVREAIAQAVVSYDRFHVVALANQAMDEVRRTEMKDEGEHVRQVMTGGNAGDKRTLKSLLWGMRKNPNGWSKEQTHCMHHLQRSTLKSARAWRLKMALREVYAQAKESNDADMAATSLQSWLSWAKRSRLEPFKKLARTIQTHLGGILRGMLDGRSNAYVEAMNGMLQQAKTAARGFRTVENFLAIAYLRMSKLKHLPTNPLVPATGRDFGVMVHRL